MDNDPDTYSWTYTPEDVEPLFNPPLRLIWSAGALVVFFAFVGVWNAVFWLLSMIGG